MLNGPGLPQSVVLQSVTFASKKGEEITRSLPHVNMEFRNCKDNWCQTLVNDCGIADRMMFSFEETTAGARLAFYAYSRAPSVALWAYPGKFAFARRGARVMLHGADYPGTFNGFEYDQQTVSMRVLR